MFLRLGIGDLKTPIPNSKSPIGNFITNWWYPLSTFCAEYLYHYFGRSLAEYNEEFDDEEEDYFDDDDEDFEDF